MSHNYDWAFNKIKLQQSIEALEQKKTFDQSVEINEATIKAEYIARAGHLAQKTTAESTQSSRTNRASVSEVADSEVGQE